MSNIARAWLLTGLFAALIGPAARAESSHPPSASADGATSLTRAEVIADTRLWIRAGVDKYDELGQYHVNSQQHERALAEYRRLRNSPAYAEELARVESERGEARDTRLSRQ